MKYNEWRDELQNNLLSVSESERRRVLDYYAEMYADRREAGFSEREIIEEFGAPYDAAQRILNDNGYDDYGSRYSHGDDESRDRRGDRYGRRCEDRWDRHESRYERHEEYREQHRDTSTYNTGSKKREDYTWIFVILCIIFAGPLFGLIMAMVGVTISLCVAPFGVIISGAGSVIASIAQMSADFWAGLATLGLGLAQVGVALVLFPLCIKLVKLMWKLFKIVFRWIRNLFKGKENA